MTVSPNRFFDPRHLHRTFAALGVALLVVTAWTIWGDHDRPWKTYQRDWNDRVASGEVAPTPPRWGQRLMRLPLLDPWAGTPGVEQIWLPELTQDFHFSRVPRSDRCVTCHRGIDRDGRDSTQPFSPHPRPELFVGPGSPHPKLEFGCTICHDGQGSATDFTFASHSPDDVATKARWQSEHGWHAEPHWPAPMLAGRFTQSRCLQCHADPLELEPSERFPDPPAPKLVEGYMLVRRLGCFGCHAMERADDDPTRRAGRFDPTRKVGPDLGDIASKLDGPALVESIARPHVLRPNSRMPRLFELHEHLDTNADRTATERFDAVEVAAITAYLLAKSQPNTQDSPPDAESAESENASPAQAQELFQLRGCVACHAHEAIEPTEDPTNFGPDLTGLASKLGTDRGHVWLVRRLSDPGDLPPQSRMPNPLLPTDEAALIADWLVGLDRRPVRQVEPVDPETAQSLARMYLVPSLATTTPNAEVDLARLGEAVIGRRGCHGCHAIAGFEGAPPVGPSLANFGRKRPETLGFGQIVRYLDQQPAEDDPDNPGDIAFYRDALAQGRREGFLWQKLRAARSFDFGVTADRSHVERLTMGRFTLSSKQREAVMTFVLGLQTDTPVDRYVARVEPQRRAVFDGRRLIGEYGCRNCHAFNHARWRFHLEPGTFDEPFAPPDYDFVHVEPSPERIAQSLQTDRSGLAWAEVVGMPLLDEEGLPLEDWDDDDRALNFFQLFEPAAIDGRVWRVGTLDVPVTLERVFDRRPSEGGTVLARLFPLALEEARRSGAAVAGMEAFGWLPPPLVSEGRRVRPEWLADYLRDPFPVRPSTVMRMPKYPLPVEEAASLVAYFLAIDGVTTPYAFAPRRAIDPTDVDEVGRMTAARRIVTDSKTFCAKCHLTGSDTSGDQPRTIAAPRLDRVAERLRPDWVRRWVANPKAILPHTPMPIHFPVEGPPLDTSLMDAPTPEQLEAVVDFLLEEKRDRSNY